MTSLFKFGTARSTPVVTAPTVDDTSDMTEAFINDRLIGGRGLRFPLKRNGLGDYITVVGDDNTAQKVVQVLATEATSGGSIGEIRAFPEFGSRLRLLIARNLNETTRELGRILVREALTLWVPEITIRQIDVVLASVDDDALIPGILITVFYRPSNVLSSREDSDVSIFKAAAQ